MAIISGTIAALGTAAKVLAAQGAKQAVVGAAKSAAKGAAKNAAKNFVTGKGRKKKKKKGGGGAPGETGGRGGSIVRTGSSSITPLIGGGGGGALVAEPDKVQVKPVSGKVSFESITIQLESIVSLTSQLETSSQKSAKDTENRNKNVRKDTEKAKNREKEEKKENRGSGVLSFLGGKAKEAGKKSGIFNFLTNILLGIGAVSLINNAKKIISGLKFLGANLHLVWLGIKGFGLLFKDIGKNLPKAFKLLKESISKFASPVTSKFKALGSGLKSIFGRLGKLIPGFVTKGFEKLTQASRAVSQGIGSIGEKIGRAVTFDTRGKGLGASSKGLDKLAGGGKGSSSIGMTRNVKNIRLKHGDEAARMYQGMVNNGVNPKRAGKYVNDSIKSGKLTSAPMRGTMGGGMKGSKLLKKGFKVSGKRVLIKFMGKGGAKVALKALSRIPVVGPLIVAATSLLSGEPVSQALFKAGGALLGGVLGSFIPIPIVGTLLGELVGEYVGDLFYTVLMGGGISALGDKLKNDITEVMSVGQKAMDWVKSGFGRFYEGIPKIKVPFVDKGLPNPAFFLNPFNMNKKLDLFWKAFFTDDPMGDGKEEKKSAQSEADKKQEEEKKRAQDLQNTDTSEMDPFVRDTLERQKQLDIANGLVADPNGDFVLKGPDGNPINFSQSDSSSPSNPNAPIQEGLRPGSDALADKVKIAPGSSNSKTDYNSAGGNNKRRIFLHWSAGSYTHPYAAYHTIFLGNGKAVRNTPYGQDKGAHTAGGNTNSIGLSMAAMKDGKENAKTWPFPPKQAQIDAMTSEAAQIALDWGYSMSDVDSMIMTHGEWERYATRSGILSAPAQRWDLDKLKPGDPTINTSIIKSHGGNSLRAMIKAKMSKIKSGNSPEQKVPSETPSETSSSQNTQTKPTPAEVTPTETAIPGMEIPQKKDDAFVLKDANGNPLSDIGKSKTTPTPAEVTPTSSESTPAEVTPTESAVPGAGKPLTVPMDQIPGENATQAEKDEYFKKLDAGELTGQSGSDVPPPAPVLPPPPAAEISPTTPPVSQSSPVESQASYEQNGGGSVVVMAPPKSSGGGSGGGGGGSIAVPIGSGDVLNSYYKTQLLGFLYKQG